MPQITDIRPQKTRRLGGARFNIFIDGKFAFALPAEALVKAGLKTDQYLTEKEMEKLIKENEFGKAYDRVLKFLSFRPRSEKEILDWFKKKQVGDETKKMVWKKLQSLNYINDEEFARWWIEQRATFRPRGKMALRVELRQKGVEKEISDKVVSEKVDELSLARRAVAKKLKIYQNLPSQEFCQKMTAFLARRGFSWETIKEVVDPAKRG